MKQAYADVVRFFLAEHGDAFRFHRARWWHLSDGIWRREDQRIALEQTLHVFMEQFFRPALNRMNRSDMNQMCAFLSQRLETRGLPGKYVKVGEDQAILRPWVEPHVSERL